MFNILGAALIFCLLVRSIQEDQCCSPVCQVIIKANRELVCWLGCLVNTSKQPSVNVTILCGINVAWHRERSSKILNVLLQQIPNVF